MNNTASDQQESPELNSEPVRLLTAAEALVLAEHDPEVLAGQLAAMHSGELAQLLLACEDQDKRQRLFQFVPDEKRGEALLELPENVQEVLLSTLVPSEIKAVVEPLNSDDVADILQVVDNAVAEQVIAHLEPDDRRELEPLLAHDEETAGGLMQVELFKVREGWPVSKVLDVLRRWGREIENLNYVYVVNDNDQFIGAVPLYELLFCEPETSVVEVADKAFPSAKAGQDQEEVARIFDKYDVFALPVVDEAGVLVGRITVDDVLDVMQEEATEDMYRLAALSGEDDLAESVRVTAWRRGIWLAVNLGTAILASFVIAQFEATLAQIVALAILMPIVASMGGIAGTQTLTVIVRGIALGRVTFDTARRALIKEVTVSAVTGLGFALVMGVTASLWFPDIGAKLGLVIAAAMLINLLAAGAAGALIPLTLQRLSIDPALASGTILTTVTDVVGFFAFLGLATVVLL